MSETQSSTKNPPPHHPPSSNTRKEPDPNDDQQRINYILETFVKNFGEKMRANPKGWQGRFRKMVGDEFAFYRGSAVLFYTDLKPTFSQDPWLQNCEKAKSIFIHGDLHAENFGTYIDRHGVIKFDVNDFDEGYIGPFVWDVKRLVASLNLITFSKAFCDVKIEKVITHAVRSYLDQVYEYSNAPGNLRKNLTTENTQGPVNKLLKESLMGSREDMLERDTSVENYQRRFQRSDIMTDIDEELRHKVLLAFQDYILTIPESKREQPWSFQVKDVVARKSPGIGSAGSISYNLLIQGRSQALETDVIIYMKPASKSAVACAITNSDVEKYFQHDGLRTVLCAYAMHTVTSAWIGYSTLDGKVPLFVNEVETHSKDLDWDGINDIDDVCQTAEYLGKAMAKIHCVADGDSIDKGQHGEQHASCIPFHVIPRHTETTIRDAINGKDDEFIKDMVSFAMKYGAIVRHDHQLFFEAFRNELIPIINEQDAPST